MGWRDSGGWRVDAGRSCCAELWAGEYERAVGLRCEFLGCDESPDQVPSLLSSVPSTDSLIYVSTSTVSRSTQSMLHLVLSSAAFDASLTRFFYQLPLRGSRNDLKVEPFMPLIITSNVHSSGSEKIHQHQAGPSTFISMRVDLPPSYLEVDPKFGEDAKEKRSQPSRHTEGIV